MPLDPLSALSAAASAIQVVDFSFKIVSKGKKIYQSADGVLLENAELETVTMRLQEMTKKLQDTIPAANAGHDREQVRLQAICKESSEAAEKLLSYLKKLKVPQGADHRIWKSLRNALKGIWSKPEVDAMAKRLEGLRAELDSHVLILLESKFDTLSIGQEAGLKALDRDLKDIVNAIVASCEVQVTNQREVLRSYSEKIDANTETLVKKILEASKSQNSEVRMQFEKRDKDIETVINAVLVSSTAQSEEIVRQITSYTQLKVRDVKNRVETRIIENLRFDTMQDRSDQIAEAHAKTFEWIFKSPQKCHKPWDDFVQWLCGGTGIYWIQGKAASGKSTLMRFLHNNSHTMNFLRTWSAGSQLLVASFFFWNSGNEEQRSQVGLLRSLLHEALKGQRQLLPHIFPEEWERFSELATYDSRLPSERWSLPRLQNAFRRLIDLAGPQLKFCFFIDGLDEFDGEPADIAQYFNDLSRSSEFSKFCLSSRPWPEFRDIYLSSPGLRLQDLTRADIKLFLCDVLGGSRHLQQLLTEDAKNASSLIEEIVDKAAGVFLWVTLVAKLLINGARNGDEISHLRHRLASLPPDLENLYDHMLKSISPLDRAEASKIFQIFRASGHGLDIPTLERALRFPDYHQVIDMEIKSGGMFTEAIDQPSTTWDRLIARLNNRSKGLLEVYEEYEQLVEHFQPEIPPHLEPIPGLTDDSHSLSDIFRTYVQHSFTTSSPGLGYFAQPRKETLKHLGVYYLHRTAKDYLEKIRVWKRLTSYTEGSEFSPYTSLLMAFVIEAKTADFDANAKCVYDWGMSTLAKLAEYNLSTSEDHVALIEELDRTLSIQWRRAEGAGEHWSNGDTNTYLLAPRDARREWNGDILSMALHAKLKCYIDAKLPLYSSPVGLKRPGLPLLAWSLGLDQWGVNLTVEPLHTEILQQLLSSGAQPNELYKGYTIWQYFIHYVHIISSLSKHISDDVRRGFYNAFKIMLQNGADPNACCVDDNHAWIQAVHLPKRGRMAYNRPEISGHVSYEPAACKRKFPEGEDGYIGPAGTNHRLHHSVTAVVEDVFPGIGELSTLLREKTAALQPLANNTKRGRKRRKRS